MKIVAKKVVKISVSIVGKFWWIRTLFSAQVLNFTELKLDYLKFYKFSTPFSWIFTSGVETHIPPSPQASRGSGWFRRPSRKVEYANGFCIRIRLIRYLLCLAVIESRKKMHAVANEVSLPQHNAKQCWLCIHCPPSRVFASVFCFVHGAAVALALLRGIFIAAIYICTECTKTNGSIW